MNVRLPSNRHDDANPYNVFGIVLAVAILIICIYLSVVRRWWRLAKRRREVGLR
jgi:magnesium transporter